MPYEWGPRYIVPSKVLKTYSGSVLLREEFDENLLYKELEELGLKGYIIKVVNPWYYRKKNTDTWIKIDESDNMQGNFPARWDTTSLKDGHYEILGLMHVFVKINDREKVIARQNIIDVYVEN